MTDPANLLMSDETVVFDVRHHPFVLWKPAVAELSYLALWLAAVSVFGFFRKPVMVIIGIAVFLVLFAWSTWSALAFTRANLTLTDRRLIYRSGVFSRHLREVPLSKINDVAVYQSVSGRVFGLGDLVVVTAGEQGQQFPFLSMPHPEQLRVQVLERIHEFQSRAASPGEMAREIAHAMNRTQPTAQIGAIPPERPPLYSEIVDQIERLDMMRERGVLTDEEFQRAKQALLDRLDGERGP